jgi:hypothetical protein
LFGPRGFQYQRQRTCHGEEHPRVSRGHPMNRDIRCILNLPRSGSLGDNGSVGRSLFDISSASVCHEHTLSMCSTCQVLGTNFAAGQAVSSFRKPGTKRWHRLPAIRVLWRAAVEPTDIITANEPGCEKLISIPSSEDLTRCHSGRRYVVRTVARIAGSSHSNAPRFSSDAFEELTLLKDDGGA